MKARAVAETPPVISSVTPRSHVMRDTRSDVNVGSREASQERSRTKHRRAEDGGGEE